MAKVTNRAPGARGFNTRDGRTVYIEPGEEADIDLAPLGAVEKAWIAAREVEVEEPIEPPADETKGADQGDAKDQDASASDTQKAPLPSSTKTKA